MPVIKASFRIQCIEIASEQCFQPIVACCILYDVVSFFLCWTVLVAECLCLKLKLTLFPNRLNFPRFHRNNAISIICFDRQPRRFVMPMKKDSPSDKIDHFRRDSSSLCIWILKSFFGPVLEVNFIAIHEAIAILIKFAKRFCNIEFRRHDRTNFS